MKKKVRLVAILVFALLFLVGWGKQSVKLLDDKKLIDLDAAIQACLHGASMSEGEENVDNPNAPENTQAPTDPKEEIDQERTIVISVRDQGITYDEEEIELSKLEYQIRQEYHDKVTVRLVEDFAEAHVYRKIRAILSKLEEEIGLEYTEGRGE